MHLLRLHFPQFLARLGVVAEQRLRAEGDQLDAPALRFQHPGCGVGLAPVPVGLGLAGRRVDVGEVRAAICLPHRLAGHLVESHHVLEVAAVVVQDQQVAVEKRRRARSAEVIADLVGALPQHLAGHGIQAAQPRRAESGIDPPLLDHRRWRGVGIELVAKLRLRHAAHHFVVQDLAGVFVHRDHRQRLSLLIGVRQPDLIAPDHG
jgi:antitoxin component of MazEF toxin-antitoxin module